VRDRLIVLRGGGDLATGVAWRLHRSGFAVAVCELAQPLAIRRKVALSTAIDEGEIDIEGMRGVRVDDPKAAVDGAKTGIVPVVISELLPQLGQEVVVDARMAKRNLDTSMDDARLVVGLGPGFTAGVDCHAVVETMRGHRLGRVIWHGSALPNTGEPGEVGGRRGERVLRAAGTGVVSWNVAIGDRVEEGDVLGSVGAAVVEASIDGVVRGLLAPGRLVTPGLKIADIDPRADPAAAFEISDKALAVGGGVLEAVMTWLSR
jgi:xanthine dehydrogenase accessory factor